MKAFLREILVTLTLAVAIFILLQATVQSFVVIGSSMTPNLHENERLLVSKVVYRLHEPERGDVVVFRPPNRDHGDFIKRIIGLPGETVEVKNGAVYVNGREVDEPYIKDSPRYTVPQQTISRNEYFVLGDNRNNSNDSHNGWTVPRQRIVGKAWLLIWPPAKWGSTPNYSLPEQMAAAANSQPAQVGID